MKHRAIVIRQPYASAILDGSKTVERRTWKIEPGWLVVVAGKTPEPGGEGLPLGVTLAHVDVVRVTGEPGAYRWHLANVLPLVQRPVRGSAAIFYVDLDLVADALPGAAGSSSNAPPAHAVGQGAPLDLATDGWCLNPKGLPYTLAKTNGRGLPRAGAFRHASEAKAAGAWWATKLGHRVTVIYDGLPTAEIAPG